LIRVAIIAKTLMRAQNVATLLVDDERLEVVGVHAPGTTTGYDESDIVDVLVVVELLLDQIPLNGPPVVALTNERVDEIPVGRSIRAWLPINSSASELGAAIIAAANDLIVLTQSQASEWLGASPRSAQLDGFEIEALTPRELQVLRMLADGLGNKEIAGQLNISDHTAKFHVAQILAKLRASSRTEAVSIGIRRGLVPI
jgi:two-component system, NarL family, response regulator YdfI